MSEIVGAVFQNPQSCFYVDNAVKIGLVFENTGNVGGNDLLFETEGKTISVSTHDAKLIHCCCAGVIASERTKLVDIDKHILS